MTLTDIYIYIMNTISLMFLMSWMQDPSYFLIEILYEPIQGFTYEATSVYCTELRQLLLTSSYRE